MLLIYHFILLLKYIGEVHEKKCTCLFNDNIKGKGQFNGKKKKAINLSILSANFCQVLQFLLDAKSTGKPIVKKGIPR
jgi:hypothetical protein